MIIEYHRPKTLQEALQLLSRKEPLTLPLGGGSVLNQPSDVEFAAVDLQSLGINKIVKRGQSLSIGATAKLQEIMDQPDLQNSLKECIRLEVTNNLRQMGSMAGTVVATDGRSPLVTALLALDTQLKIEPGSENISLGNVLPVRKQKLSHRIIVQFEVPLNPKLVYHYVARTPADLPVVCVAAARWPSGRTRLTLGGFGSSPVLALDGPDMDGAVEAAVNAYNQAEDQWASAEYRREIAAVLTRRCLEDLAEG